MYMKKIEQLLNEENIKGKKGFISFDLAGISFHVASKDIVGGVLQEWFENWMLSKKIVFSKPSNAQDWPDFYLGDGQHLEIKAFNYDASPAFDIGNFDAYTRSLLEHPQRLDSDHLIFGYRSSNKTVEIVDFWVKKVWEMTGVSPTNCLELQVKQKVPVNIRPKNWCSKTPKTFNSRRDFVVALAEALNKFHPQRYPAQNINWLESVEQAYFQATNTPL